MAKIKPVAVNLATKANVTIATMCDELPKAWHYFVKGYGGPRKYQKMEEEMLDKALKEERDQLTDINYYISPKGNRWMTYTQVEYFPKAKYALAFHYSFIYYETIGSCGAFFPTYSKRQREAGKVKKNGKPDGIIVYTSHFFYQMSQRTGIEYRSKELIRKFISERCERAMTTSADWSAIQKFNGGHGFGKVMCTEPSHIEIRTYIDDASLSASKRKQCEPVDNLHQLIKDGMCISDVAIHTMLNQNLTPEEDEEEWEKTFAAVKKLGMERETAVLSKLWLVFVRLLEVRFNKQADDMICAAVTYTIANLEKAADFAHKWEPYVDDDVPEDKIMEMYGEMIDVLHAGVKKLGLKHITREYIDKHLIGILYDLKKSKPETA